MRATVHDSQIVGDFPRDRIDLPLSVIVTPSRTLRVTRPFPPPSGLDWTRLTEEQIQAMPLLRKLKTGE